MFIQLLDLRVLARARFQLPCYLTFQVEFKKPNYISSELLTRHHVGSETIVMFI